MQFKKVYEDNVRVAQAARGSLVLYNVEEEKALMDDLYECLTVLSNSYNPEIREIRSVPVAHFIELPEVKLREIRSWRFIDLPEVKLKDLNKPWTDLRSLMKGECPTCHRPFYSCPTYTKGM
jgi:hypothetical protein